jgi:site-specific DNA recombinase
MGRLMLNVLLSFAQFEREIIGERTRDKVQAARRRGRWTGGQLVLGYRLDPDKRGLCVVEEEAKLVRLVFDLYLRARSIDAVADQLNALGFTQKKYETRKGVARGGGPWTRNGVHSVLRNSLYLGKVRGQGGRLYLGEHDPIVEPATFEAAARSLDDRTTGRKRRSRLPEYLLAGILRCGPCGAPMWPSTAKGRNGRTYRYYRCAQQQRRAHRCPHGGVAAQAIEGAVVSQVAQVARRDDVRRKVLDRVTAEVRYAGELKERRDRLQGELQERSAEAKRLLDAFAGAETGGKLLGTRLGELEAEIEALRTQVADHDQRLVRLQEACRGADEVAALLESFDGIWDVLEPPERFRLVRLIVRQVTLEPKGLRIALYDLPAETSPAEEEATA